MGNTSNSRAALRSAAAFMRCSRLTSVSRYRVCATDAGPRASLNNSTSISKSPPSLLMRSMSPTFTSRAGFAGWLPMRILPNSQDRAASVRVLKNLAAHNHLSTRTEFMLLHATRGFLPVRSDQVGAGASATQSSMADPIILHATLFSAKAGLHAIILPTRVEPLWGRERSGSPEAKSRAQRGISC